MPLASPLDYLPLWLLLPLTIVVVVLSVEAGYRLGAYRRRRTEQEKEAPVGAIVAATSGLLAFMLAFTFGFAATRFEARRQVVVDEANAIGTTFLRAGLLPDQRGVRIRKLLREYVDVRLDAVNPDKLEQALKRSEELQHEVWKEAEAIGLKRSGSIVVGLFIQSLNSMIDLHATRVQIAIRNRIPGIVWAILYLVTVLTMAGVGYHAGLARTSRSLAIIMLVATFSAIMLLIADLDRPREGLLRVSQQALVDLRSTMDSYLDR